MPEGDIAEATADSLRELHTGLALINEAIPKTMQADEDHALRPEVGHYLVGSESTTRMEESVRERSKAVSGNCW